MRTRLAFAPLLGLAVLLAACTGGGATPAPATSAPPTEAPATPVPATEAPPTEAPMTEAPTQPGGSGVTVAAADHPLGTILVDGAGLTLYVFVPDAAGASTCYDGCATAWPPLLADGDPVAGAGVTAGDLGTTERTDGTLQVTHMGWPLYYFQGDQAAGDANGQGLNDVWWVVSPDGTMIGAPTASRELDPEY